MHRIRSFVCAGLVAIATATAAQERLPTIPPASYSEEQKQAAA